MGGAGMAPGPESAPSPARAPHGGRARHDGHHGLSTPALLLAATHECGWDRVYAESQWQEWYAAAPQPHFTQAWCYGEGKRAEGWQVERLVIRDAGGVSALCQLLVKRPLGIPVTRINRAPVFLRDAGREAQLAALRALRRRWRYGLRGLALMAPSL